MLYDVTVTVIYRDGVKAVCTYKKLTEGQMYTQIASALNHEEVASVVLAISKLSIRG
jgi:hypothetical protein